MSGALLLSGCATIFKDVVKDVHFSGVSLISANDAPFDSKMPPQQDRKVLLVSLTTGRDLESAAQDHDIFALHADVFYCDTKEKVSWSGVYAVPPPGSDSYHVWFDYYSLVHFADDYVQYDLRRNPKDLCLTISGNPYMGLGVGLLTNTVVIPRQAIIDALRSAPS